MCLQLVPWLLQEEGFQGSGRLSWLVYQPPVSMCFDHKETTDQVALHTEFIYIYIYIVI